MPTRLKTTFTKMALITNWADSAAQADNRRKAPSQPPLVQDKHIQNKRITQQNNINQPFIQHQHKHQVAGYLNNLFNLWFYKTNI